jgi:hypothetical protein
MKMLASQKINALRIKIKNPNVSSVTGNVRSKKIGRTVALRKPNINAATTADFRSLMTTPGTIFATKRRANTKTKKRTNKCVTPLIYHIQHKQVFMRF